MLFIFNLSLSQWSYICTRCVMNLPTTLRNIFHKKSVSHSRTYFYYIKHIFNSEYDFLKHNCSLEIRKLFRWVDSPIKFSTYFFWLCISWNLHLTASIFILITHWPNENNSTTKSVHNFIDREKRLFYKNKLTSISLKSITRLIINNRRGAELKP